MNRWQLLLAAGTLAVASAAAVRLARRHAIRRALLDIPNDRSSHTVPVPRLGGAAFMPLVFGAILTATWMTDALTPLVAALLGGMAVLYVISLLDDLRSVATSVRFAVQFAIAIGFLAVASACDVIGLSAVTPRGLVECAIWTLWIVGLTNIYNFMDGIDGIAGLQAVVAGAGWTVAGWWLNASTLVIAGAFVVAGALGFLTLNWPPARIFMGDAGSTVLGFVFATLPVIASAGGAAPTRVGWWIAGFAMVWPFVADGAFTIVRRLLNRENIFRAHRSHLYQRLVIAGVSHARVTLAYGGLAAMGAGLALYRMRRPEFGIGWALGVMAIAFVALVWATLQCERAMRRKTRGVAS